MITKSNEIEKRNNSYRRVMQVRAIDEAAPNQMIVEGKAISYDDPTVLFKMDGIEYKEVIARGAFDSANLDHAFLKYNHSDNVMVMASYKNHTLEFTARDDGVYIRASLANTTAGRDLYELIKRGDIDKMSFAFTILEESYNNQDNMWTVYRIDKLYDVAAVTVPAYENTALYSRRLNDIETRIQEIQDLELKRQQIKTKINLYKQGA